MWKHSTTTNLVTNSQEQNEATWAGTDADYVYILTIWKCIDDTINKIRKENVLDLTNPTQYKPNST